MREVDKNRPSVVAINSYPVRVEQGQEILRDGRRVAIVPESGMCASEADLFKIIAAQHKAVHIAPDKADLSIEVGPDGVFLGFFSDDGKAALVNLDKLSASGVVSSAGVEALTAWATDRRKQATAVAG